MTVVESERLSHRCARNERCADRERHIDRPAVCEPEPGAEPCRCHDGPGRPCTIPGGCGHLHPETETWLGAWITTDAGLCESCTREVVSAIRHLKGDVAELTQHIGRGNATTGDKVTLTREPPIPLRPGVEALRAEIVDQVQTWAEIVAVELGIDWSSPQLRSRLSGAHVTRAADLLATAVDTLVGLGPQELLAWADGRPVWDHDLDCQDAVFVDGIDAALHLTELHWRAWRIAGHGRLTHHRYERCKECGQRALTVENGSDSAVCWSERCRGRTRIPVDELGWLTKATIAVEQAAQETTEAVA